MNVCAIKVGASSVETLARFHLGRPSLDPGAIPHGGRDGTAWTGQTLGVVAGFGPRSHSLSNVASVLADPPRADAELRNADAVRGCVAIIHRGGDVPLVLKARRAMRAGARAVVIVNSDDKPLLADAHLYPDGRKDAGEGIEIPVLVAPSSAAELLESTGASVTLEYDTSTTSPINVEDYESKLRAATHTKLPEGVPAARSPARDEASLMSASRGANLLSSGSGLNDSLGVMQQQYQQDQVQEQWSTEQLAEARRRAESELAEMRARLGGHSGGHSSGGGSGVLGGHLAASIEAASPAPWQSLVAPMMFAAAPPAAHQHGGSGGMSSEVEALRALVSAEADSELREIRSQLTSMSSELLSAKSEAVSAKGDALAVRFH